MPLFDPSGRLFLASEDPVPDRPRLPTCQQQELDLKYGVVTINEVRRRARPAAGAVGRRALAAAPLAPTDYDGRAGLATAGPQQPVQDAYECRPLQSADSRAAITHPERTDVRCRCSSSTHYGHHRRPARLPDDRPGQRIALDALLKRPAQADEFEYRKAVARAGADRAAARRAQRRVLDHHRGPRPRQRGRPGPRHERQPVPAQPDRHAAARLPPAAGRPKSLWRKVVKDGDRQGIKAKTHYPPRPADWPRRRLAARHGLRPGPGRPAARQEHRLSADQGPRADAAREREQPGWANVELVIDEWLLLEYACCFLPANRTPWSRRCPRR